MTLSTARPGTFLVVDDSALHHQMYRLIFSKGSLAGSTLYHAMNGREGYALLAAHPELTVVLLDLNMPEMNGLEFLARRQAEKLHPHIPIVLVTTESTPDDEARGRTAGAWDYLRKPFQPADVARLVERLQAERAPAA
ncbi:MAG TPA: response regulator [Gemmatimonadales bacterium]|nr:response regulator [Gemmatimonadales bacterium]